MNEQVKRWRRASVSINPAALKNNLKKVRECAPNSKVMAVIKANAYGHGMLVAAKHLDEADLFAVAMPAEAYALRADGCAKPTVVLHGFCDLAELKQFSSLNISTVVHQRAQLDCLLDNELDKAVDVWLKVDTGMHRLGIAVEQLDQYFGLLRNCKNVADVTVMSHFASADEKSNSSINKQLEEFVKVTNDIDVDCSMANSAAILSLNKSHFEVVRPGIMLYGSSPINDTSADSIGLQSVMQFESMVIEIKPVKAGEAIGYGGTFTADKDMTIGIIAAGYADGYPRHAKNGTPVWIKGQRCNLLGRVSMDSICIDLTQTNVEIGERAVLWGKELSVDEVAHCSGTIAYELLCCAGAASLMNECSYA